MERQAGSVILVVGLISLIAVASWCASHAGSTPPAHADAVVVPQLTELEAIAMAEQFVMQRRVNLDMSDYLDRLEHYHGSLGFWSVSYYPKRSRWPGDHFTVWIDTQTRKMVFVGGA